MELFDLHVRLGASRFGYELGLDQLQRQMEQHDIARAVLCPVRLREGSFADANDLVAAAVATAPDRFAGFARVDPWLGEAALRELDRAVRVGGLQGLLLDPWEEHYVISSTMVDPVVERAGALALPVLVAGGYPNFSHPSQLGALAARHPQVQFIATHGGQLNISGMLLADARAMLAAHPNIAIETSGIYREDFIEDTIEEFGAERVYFGSGAPVFDQGFETLRITMAHLSEETKTTIGSGNLTRLLARRARQT